MNHDKNPEQRMINLLAPDGNNKRKNAAALAKAYNICNNIRTTNTTTYTSNPYEEGKKNKKKENTPHNKNNNTTTTP